MAESLIITGASKTDKYKSLVPQIKALVEGEPDMIANLSNIIAALKQAMDFLWVGVYFVKDLTPALSGGERGKRELVLGPFQGPIACTRITLGKGVCGTAWKEKKTLIVTDVDQFPGHIACSSESKSEIVLPVFNKKAEVALVLDVDSSKLNDFDETDKMYLQEVVKIIEQLL